MRIGRGEGGKGKPFQRAGRAKSAWEEVPAPHLTGMVGSRATEGMRLMMRKHSAKTAGTRRGGEGEVEAGKQWGMGRRRRELAEVKDWLRKRRTRQRGSAGFIVSCAVGILLKHSLLLATLEACRVPGRTKKPFLRHRAGRCRIVQLG